MEFRKVFDTIPDQFDKYRPRYSAEQFADLIEYAEIGPGKTVLELGPGTGQATDPILSTGCDYHAIELGEHLVEMMKRKYGKCPNFSIVNDDFIAHDFGTHCDHIVIPEPYRSKFFNGLREAVLDAGNKIVFHDTFVLFLVRKPL